MPNHQKNRVTTARSSTTTTSETTQPTVTAHSTQARSRQVIGSPTMLHSRTQGPPAGSGLVGRGDLDPEHVRGDPPLPLGDDPDEQDRAEHDGDPDPDDDEHPADDEEDQPEQQRHQPEHLLGGVRREPQRSRARRHGARDDVGSLMHPSSPSSGIRTVGLAPPRLGSWDP